MMGRAAAAAVALCLCASVTGSPKMPNHKVKPGTDFNKNIGALLDIMIDNAGMPKSYSDVIPGLTSRSTRQNYWTSNTYLNQGAITPHGDKVPIDSMIAIQERTLTHEGLNLYDGSTWQIALSLWGLDDLAEMYERNVLYTGSTGSGQLKHGNAGPVRVFGIRQGIPNFRANTKDFKYGNKNITGDQLKKMPTPGNVTIFPFDTNTGGIKDGVQMVEGSLFYRMTGPNYWMKDPLSGFRTTSWQGPWPNIDPATSWDQTGYIHWNDWKPITGENVWGTMIGPLQRLWLSTNGNLLNATCGRGSHPVKCDFKTWMTTPGAVQLGISILPGLLALKSDLGSLYHCPWGSKLFPEDGDEGFNVSNENNFSAYAALTMLQQVLKKYCSGTSDPHLMYGIATVDELVKGLDNWIDNHLIPPQSVVNGEILIPQGGHVIGSNYHPVPLTGFGGIAVDCQTWGMAVIGANRIDNNQGAGTAFNIWNTTKYYTGHFINGELAGVGYTANVSHPKNEIWSAEWTFGAITMCQRLARDYKDTNPEWSAQLEKDASSMYHYTTQPYPKGLQFKDGSYVYANARFFIPWGWFANPIPATCSTAWAVMHQQNFNPFVLGGDDLKPLKPHVVGTNLYER